MREKKVERRACRHAALRSAVGAAGSIARDAGILLALSAVWTLVIAFEGIIDKVLA